MEDNPDNPVIIGEKGGISASGCLLEVKEFSNEAV